MHTIISRTFPLNNTNVLDFVYARYGISSSSRKRMYYETLSFQPPACRTMYTLYFQLVSFGKAKKHIYICILSI